MKIKFWGVRGSIPCPGASTVKYGGNTPCIEVQFDHTDKQVIIDAGSGIRELGNHMMSNDFLNGSMEADIFLTHTHWDHIMGFPFFTPIYIPGTKLKIYGPVSFESESLKEVVGNQMSYKYFPVRQVELASDIEYIELREGPVETEDTEVQITTKYLNHPILCLGYKFEHNGKTLCTLYDTEPFQNLFVTDPNDPSYDETMAIEGKKAADLQNEQIVDFVKNADLLIRDAQYTQEEYAASKTGWGHTAIEYAIKSSKAAGVKKLALFHHEPLYTDEKLDQLYQEICQPENSKEMEIFFAKEGMEIAI